MKNTERRDLGIPYIADKDCFAEMARTRRLVQKLNTMDASDFNALKLATAELLGTCENGIINPPFHCDYGFHIHVGKNFYANYNCTILDVAEVHIGDNCLFGPNVSLYTAGHPIRPDMRNTGYEYGVPITIGDNVWLGGNVVVCPGVSIGSNVVVGAGSVVTKDIPEDCIAAGNPCKVIRKITDEDRKYYFKKRMFDQESLENIQRLLKKED